MATIENGLSFISINTCFVHYECSVGYSGQVDPNQTVILSANDSKVIFYDITNKHSHNIVREVEPLYVYICNIIDVFTLTQYTNSLI